MLGLGADPDDAVALDDLGELRVLGEEAVAGMDGVGVDDLGGRDDVRDVEVGSVAGGGPMQTVSSARRTCIASASAVEWTATVRMPISWQAR